jgi:hypothetical protein
MPEQTRREFTQAKLNRYIETMDIDNWRVYKPFHLFRKINDLIMKRLEI